MDASQGGSDGPNVWDRLEHAVAQDAEPSLDLWSTIQERLDPSLRKPRRAAVVEVSAHATRAGREYYVLGNALAGTYLKIGQHDLFLWERMDGEHSVRALAVSYFAEFGAFPLRRIVKLLEELKENRLLERKPLQLFGSAARHLEERSLAGRLQRFSDRATQREFSFKDTDGLFGLLYRRGGWVLFTRPARALFALLTGVGVTGFVYLLVTNRYELLSTAGSYGLGLVILVVSSYAMLFIHECGHALACKSYGRRVPRGGLLFYMGSPAFFVDTTDIWMAPRRARIVVSVAGPLATVIVGSLLAIVAVLCSPGALGGVLFQLAFSSYVGALFNLNPLLELDGYYILMDWLEIPLLRKKSLAFVRQRLMSRLFRERIGLNREERIFTIYGLLAALWTGITVALGIYLWQSQLRLMVNDLLSGKDILSAVIVGGLALFAGANLVLGMAVKAVLLASTGWGQVRSWIRMRSRTSA